MFQIIYMRSGESCIYLENVVSFVYLCYAYVDCSNYTTK